VCDKMIFTCTPGDIRLNPQTGCPHSVEVAATEHSGCCALRHRHRKYIIPLLPVPTVDDRLHNYDYSIYLSGASRKQAQRAATTRTRIHAKPPTESWRQWHAKQHQQIVTITAPTCNMHHTHNPAAASSCLSSRMGSIDIVSIAMLFEALYFLEQPGPKHCWNLFSL
jgi:hypothetical protein